MLTVHTMAVEWVVLRFPFSLTVVSTIQNCFTNKILVCASNFLLSIIYKCYTHFFLNLYPFPFIQFISALMIWLLLHTTQSKSQSHSPAVSNDLPFRHSYLTKTDPGTICFFPILHSWQLSTAGEKAKVGLQLLQLMVSYHNLVFKGIPQSFLLVLVSFLTQSSWWLILIKI